MGIAKEKPKLKAVNVTVESVSIATREPKEGGKLKESTDLLVFHCKHPDAEELIEISTVKFEKAGKMEQSAIWYKPDEDGNVPFESGVAYLMRFYDVEEYGEFVGNKVATTTNQAGFLILKAY